MGATETANRCGRKEGSRPGRATVAAFALAAVVVPASPAAAQPPPRFAERVDVERVIVDARVLDDQGNPVHGLTAGDFEVIVDGRTARVETATWFGARETETGAETAPRPAAAARAEIGAPPVSGGLVVLLFQKDLEPSRIVGLMQMLLRSGQILETLTPHDRVAILSFDSHLRIWTDFTSDRERLRQVMAHDLLFERPAAVEPRSTPSLVARLAPDRGRRTYTIERALELIGEALEPLPGSKLLVLIGHGFGRFGSGGVTMEPGYSLARRALVASRTAVVSLDVTRTDYHSLEVGLQLVAEQTGGFYARTHLFPEQAVRRLSGAMAGYYVLSVEQADGDGSTRDVSVRLTRWKGQVFAASASLGRERQP